MRSPHGVALHPLAADKLADHYTHCQAGAKPLPQKLAQGPALMRHFLRICGVQLKKPVGKLRPVAIRTLLAGRQKQFFE